MTAVRNTGRRQIAALTDHADDHVVPPEPDLPRLVRLARAAQDREHARRQEATP